VRAPTTPVVPWAFARRLVRALLDERGQVTDVAGADQFDAYVRDFLDARQLAVVDPLVVFHGLAFLSLVACAARSGEASGTYSHDAAEQVAGLCRALAQCLAVHAPPEAVAR
jgi:hypothetical protein